MSEKYHHFQSYEWLGLFSYPDGSVSFPGKLKYSPEFGVQLEYLCDMGAKIGEATYLVGALESGKKCVLVGEFKPHTGGLRIDNISIYRGTWGFPYCIFGTDLSPDNRYTEINADFSNFQEFCFPQGFKSTAPWRKDGVVLFSNDSVEISLQEQANFEFAGDHYANVFHSDNPEILKEIGDFWKLLREKYPQDYLFARKDIHWYLQVRHPSGATARDLLLDIFSYSDLLSLLLFSPVRAVEVSILGEYENEKKVRHPVLMTLSGLNSDALEFLKKETSHQLMPINLPSIDASVVFERWWKSCKGYSSFVPKIVHDFGHRTAYQSRSELVLLLTQLEKINDEIKGDKSRKYQNPIQHYGCAELQSLLRSALSLHQRPEEELGIVLSDLRNEIAHFGRPIKLLDNLTLRRLIIVCRCLDIVVASHIYQQLGITEQTIDRFQKRHVGNIQSMLNP